MGFSLYKNLLVFSEKHLHKAAVKDELAIKGFSSSHGLTDVFHFHKNLVTLRSQNQDLHALSISTDELCDEIRVQVEGEFMENKMEEAAGRIGDGVGLVNVVFSSIKDVQSVASKSSGEGFEAFIATLGLFDFL